MSYKGVFRPKNPQKYKGDPTRIIYRSSIELRFMNFLDTHPSIISWRSEEMFVPYRSPKDGRIHRYFPDFIIEKVTPDGEIVSEMIEVKSYRETLEPVAKKASNGRYTRSSLRAMLIYAINEAKWKAAREYCLNKNMEFRLITERDLTPNGRF